MCNIIDGSDILNYFTWSCHSCLECKSANLADTSFLILRDRHLAVFTVGWKKSRWQDRTLAMCTLWGNLALQYILLGLNTRVQIYVGTLRELRLFLIFKQQSGLSLCCYFTEENTLQRGKRKSERDMRSLRMHETNNTRAMNTQDGRFISEYMSFKL